MSSPGLVARFTMLSGILICTLIGFALASPQQPGIVSSTQIDSSGRVTFHLIDPNAKEVFLNLEGSPRLPMARESGGSRWSVTTGPLAPNLYGYSFTADGVTLLDPLNPRIKPNLLEAGNLLEVPGKSPLPWDEAAVAHGVVHHHFYRSSVIRNYDSEYYVYTPPDYDAAARSYPVLYLLHGFSDGADAWVSVGRANYILDNLIASGTIKPMIVVMPLAYGLPQLLHAGDYGASNLQFRERNLEKFREVLTTEIMPQVDKSYRIAPGRENRAIAGLSMGGAESLFVGLNRLDDFAWIGAFSAAVADLTYDPMFPSLSAADNKRIRLLWIACGTEDNLLLSNRKLGEWLKLKGVDFTAVETPGGHTWMLWRNDLVTFLALLFRNR